MAYSRPGGNLLESSASAALAAAIHIQALAFESGCTPIAKRAVPGVFEVGAIVFRAQFGMAHVFQQHQAIGRVFDDDVVELLRGW